MKSAALLIITVVILAVTNLGFDMVYDSEVANHGWSHSPISATVDENYAFSGNGTIELLEAFGMVEHQENEPGTSGSVPFTLLFLTGLFGFAFWDRSSIPMT